MKKRLFSLFTGIGVFFYLSTIISPKAETLNPAIVYVLSASGPCTLYDSQQKITFQGDGTQLEGKELPFGTQIQTGNDADVILLHYPDMTRITLDQNSLIKIQDEHSIFETLGRVWIKISKSFFTRSSFEVQTPNAAAIAHGTQYSVKHSNASTDVHVFEGNVGFNNGLQPVTLQAGQAVEGAQKGVKISPHSFDNQHFTNEWWRWNFEREKNFENFLKTHPKEMNRILRQNQGNLHVQALRFHRLIKNQIFWRHHRFRRRLISNPVYQKSVMQKRFPNRQNMNSRILRRRRNAGNRLLIQQKKRFHKFGSHRKSHIGNNS